MATYYWVGAGGTWDNGASSPWSSTSGGAGGAGVPTSADDVIFDGNSSTISYRVVLGISVSNFPVCRNITVNPPSNTSATVTIGRATTSGGIFLNINGNVNMSNTRVIVDHNGGITHRGSGNVTINYMGGKGLKLDNNVYFTNTATYILQANLECGNNPVIMQNTCSMYLSNNQINCSSFEVSTRANGTLDFANTGKITAACTFNTLALFSFQPGSLFNITGNNNFEITSLGSGSVWSVDWFTNFATPNTNNTPNLKINVATVGGILQIDACKDLNLTVPTTGNAVSANIIFGDIYLSGNYSNLGVTAWCGANTGGTANNTLYSNNKTITSSNTFTISGNTTFKFDTNFTSSQSVVFQQGNLDIVDKSFKVGTMTVSTTNNRVINFGTNGYIQATGSATYPWDLSGNNFSITGTANVISSRGISHDSTIPINFNIITNVDDPVISSVTVANTITLLSNTSNIFYARFQTGSIVYGDIILGSNIGLSGNVTLVGSANSELRITVNAANTLGYSNLDTLNISKTPGSKLTINTASGVLLVNTGLSLINLNSGTLELNNSNLQIRSLISNNSNVRSIDFGSKYMLYSFLDGGSGEDNILVIGNTGNLTVTGTKTIIANGFLGGTKSFINRDTDSAESSTFKIIVGSSNTTTNVSFAGALDEIDLSNHSGRVRFNSNTALHGNLIFGNFSNQFYTNAGAYADLLFVGDSRTQYFVTLGKTVAANVYKNGNGSLIFQNNYTVAGIANGSGNFFLNAGNTTFTTQNVVISSFFSINTNARVLTMGTGTWNIRSSWSTTSTNLTIYSNTSTIAMTSNAAKSFDGGNQTYYILQQSSANNVEKPGELTITGNNNFYDVQTPRSATQNATIIFESGSVNITNVFTGTGVAANILNLQSTISQNTAFFGPETETNVSYIRFTDIAAPRASKFRAYISNGNINASQYTNRGITFKSANGRFSGFF